MIISLGLKGLILNVVVSLFNMMLNCLNFIYLLSYDDSKYIYKEGKYKLINKEIKNYIY